MLVRQLVGRRAGDIIDMDYADAMTCKAAGTIALIGAPEPAFVGEAGPEPVVLGKPARKARRS